MLGSGGFGSVHRGVYKSQQVAIKRLFVSGPGGPGPGGPGGSSFPTELLLEFGKEVHALQKLRHSKLVSILGAVVTSSELCIVLEYMPRGNL